MPVQHKVFVSFHHANDQNYKEIFNLRFSNKFGILTRGSVELGDIDPNVQVETIRRRIRDEYLRDASVTVVLVGTQTWQRKHVDWEIYASLRDTPNNPRSGLMGILLPSFHKSYGCRADRWRGCQKVIPPRLVDNLEVGFASIHDWSEDPDSVQEWIHEAYLRKSRNGVQPNNARAMFAKNRSGSSWID